MVELKKKELTFKKASDIYRGLTLLKKIGFVTGKKGAKLSFIVFRTASDLSTIIESISEYEKKLIEKLNGDRKPNGMIIFDGEDGQTRKEKYELEMETYLNENTVDISLPEISLDDLDDSVAQSPNNMVFEYYPIKE